MTAATAPQAAGIPAFSAEISSQDSFPGAPDSLDAQVHSLLHL